MRGRTRTGVIRRPAHRWAWRRGGGTSGGGGCLSRAARGGTPGREKGGGCPPRWLGGGGGGQVGVMGLLTGGGGDVNRRQDNGAAFTPLLMAAMRGELTAVELLVKHGARLTDISGGGLSAERLAKEGNHQDVAAYLKALR